MPGRTFISSTPTQAQARSSISLPGSSFLTPEQSPDTRPDCRKPMRCAHLSNESMFRRHTFHPQHDNVCVLTHILRGRKHSGVTAHLSHRVSSFTRRHTIVRGRRRRGSGVYGGTTHSRKCATKALSADGSVPWLVQKLSTRYRG